MPKPFCPPGSEDDILKRLSLHFPDTPETLLIGRGDDCAMLRPGGPLCVSNDLFLEDVHFRRSYFTPEDVGYKALAVNISDLAACGARPQARNRAMPRVRRHFGQIFVLFTAAQCDMMIK